MNYLKLLSLSLSIALFFYWLLCEDSIRIHSTFCMCILPSSSVVSSVEGNMFTTSSRVFLVDCLSIQQVIFAF